MSNNTMSMFTQAFDCLDHDGKCYTRIQMKNVMKNIVRMHHESGLFVKKKAEFCMKGDRVYYGGYRVAHGVNIDRVRCGFHHEFNVDHEPTGTRHYVTLVPWLEGDRDPGED